VTRESARATHNPFDDDSASEPAGSALRGSPQAAPAQLHDEVCEANAEEDAESAKAHAALQDAERRTEAVRAALEKVQSPSVRPPATASMPASSMVTRVRRRARRWQARVENPNDELKLEELNDKLRLQAGRDTDDGGTPPAPDRPRAETGGAAPAAPGAEGGGGWITFADEDGAAAVVAGDWGTAEGALIDLGEEARGEGSSRGSQQAQQAEEAEGGPGRAHAAHGPASGAGAPAEAGDAGKGDSDSEQDELAALFGAGLPPAPASGGGAPLPGGSADGGAGVDLLS